MKKLQIILADDHQMFRDGVRAVLADEKDIEVMGEVGDGTSLFDLLRTVHPDLVITDIHMPGMSGIEIAKRLKHEYPDIKVLMLSMHTNEEFITKALHVGADGYLPKDTSMMELLDAIKSICEGENYFNKSISDTILKSMIKSPGGGDDPENAESLTSREKEIVLLVVDGMTNKEIADKLCISVRTVDSHKNNVMQKLHLKSSVELVKYAIRTRMVNLYD